MKWKAATLGLWLLALGLAASAFSWGPKPTVSPGQKYYLFAYFKENEVSFREGGRRFRGGAGFHLAWSGDGLKWEKVADNRLFFKPAKSRMLRDPFIKQGPDGIFHLVWTTGWNENGIGYASSRDLVHWENERILPVMAGEPGVLNCWAPELIYDPAAKNFLIYWSSTIPGRFPETEAAGDKGWNHRIYCCTTKDFQTFSKTRLFFNGGFNVIDATMLKAGGKYYLVVKDETLAPVKKNLRIASGEAPEGPWTNVSEPFTISWVEGPSALRIGEYWYVYFDHYASPHYYGAVRSKDLKTWEDVSQQMSFPPDHRHGAVLKVSREIVERLRGASPASPAK